ncbi:MAG: hypothetical protein NTZ34_06510 [Chloroflexi bacterium]|nr:hypothetical protein [Chloroflexota bacterium]
MHPYENEHYYEWWYFDARFTNGYSCVAIWHWRNAALTPHLPSIQMYIYTPEGKRHSGLRVINPVECQAKPDICDVTMKDSYVRQQGAVYSLSMLTKGVGCELTFEPQVPGWKHNNGLLYPTSDMIQGWIIACPRANVKGTLHLNGTTIPVEGSGYHDHNWGNALLSDCCNGWYWGRLSDSKYTAIFYKIYQTDNSEQRMLYLADNQCTLLDTDKYQFAVEEEASHEELLSPYAKKIKLNVEQDDIKLEYKLNAINVVEAMRLSKDPLIRADYGRFLADYEGSVSIGQSSDHVHGQGIYERFIFR